MPGPIQRYGFGGSVNSTRTSRSTGGTRGKPRYQSRRVIGEWSPTSCTTCWTRSNVGLPGKLWLVGNRRGDATVPDWTPEQLTDGELISRKAELEGKLKVFTRDSPRAALLRADLAAVIAEQEDRKRTRSSRQTRLAGV
jgi:hypothetical protein